MNKELIQKINNYSFLLFAFSVNFPKTILIYSMVLWIVSSFFVLHVPASKQLKSKKFLVLYLLLVLMGGRVLVSLWHNDFYALATKLFDTQLALVVVPVLLLFVKNKYYDFNKSVLAYVLGITVTGIIVVVYFYLSRYNFIQNQMTFIPESLLNTKGIDVDVLIFRDFITEKFKHRAGMGANLSLAVAGTIYLIKQFNIRKIAHLSGILIVSMFNLAVIYASGSRSGLLSAIIVIIIGLFYFFKSHKYYLIGSLLLLAVAVVGVGKLKTTRKSDNNNLVSKLFTTPNTITKSDIANIDPRIRIWHAAVQVIEEQPLLGVGYGQVKMRILDKYEHFQYQDLLNEKYNSHNQFLQFSIESGIWSGFLLILILLALVYVTNFHFLFYAFSGVFFTYCFFEDALVVINGVSLLVFFTALAIIFHTLTPKNNSLKNQLYAQDASKKPQ